MKTKLFCIDQLVSTDSLTSKLQNEHHEIGSNRVNFQENSIYLPKNVQIGNLRKDGTNGSIF
jgi:hypothetical protein